jgi:hypothetical protein
MRSSSGRVTAAAAASRNSSSNNKSSSSVSPLHKDSPHSPADSPNNIGPASPIGPYPSSSSSPTIGILWDELKRAEEMATRIRDFMHSIELWDKARVIAATAGNVPQLPPGYHQPVLKLDGLAIEATRHDSALLIHYCRQIVACVAHQNNIIIPTTPSSSSSSATTTSGSTSTSGQHATHTAVHSSSTSNTHTTSKPASRRR